MQAAINIQRIARNLPWVNKYVLHVSQIVFETFAMDSCTGSALVCLYWMRPKIAPTTHMKMPKYINAMPPTPPRLLKCTPARSGMLISASLAKALLAKPDRQIRIIMKGSFLVFLIHLARRD